MITLKDIKKAINLKLTTQFGFEINSNDVKEGFKKPSFFVDFDNISLSSTVEQKQRSLTVRIYFFPTDRYHFSLEILDVQERLEKEFDLKLQVLDRHLNITEVDASVTDGVLVFNFNIEFEEGKEYIEAELMQTLDERVN